MANARHPGDPAHFQEEQRGQGRGSWLGGSSACPGGPGAAEDAAAGTVKFSNPAEALLLPSNLHSLPFWPSVCKLYVNKALLLFIKCNKIGKQ